MIHSLGAYSDAEGEGKEVGDGQPRARTACGSGLVVVGLRRQSKLNSVHTLIDADSAALVACVLSLLVFSRDTTPKKVYEVTGASHE